MSLSAAQPLLPAQPYLILGGTTRAATSALFAHLSLHPRVAPSRLKEPRFFLDPDYPLETAFPFARGLAAYEALFPARADALRLEATPDYLHTPGTAARLAESLREVRVVFSLRDPSARLVSWYRYARAAARLPRGMTFDEYVARQRTHAGGEQPFRALSQGRYADDLGRYLDVLGRARVHVLFHEELVAEPAAVLRPLAEFAGLAYEPLARPFARENPALATKSPRLHRRYVRFAFHLRNVCATRPRLFSLLRGVHGRVKPLYARVNARAEEPLDPDPALAAWLTEYYAPSVQRLAGLVGRAPPWNGYGLDDSRAEALEAAPSVARRSHAS